MIVMTRFKPTAYNWLPASHWREENGATPCRHEGVQVSSRAGADALFPGHVYYWCVCPGCGLEVGPFVTPKAAAIRARRIRTHLNGKPEPIDG